MTKDQHEKYNIAMDTLNRTHTQLNRLLRACIEFEKNPNKMNEGDMTNEFNVLCVMNGGKHA